MKVYLGEAWGARGFIFLVGGESGLRSEQNVCIEYLILKQLRDSSNKEVGTACGRGDKGGGKRGGQ